MSSARFLESNLQINPGIGEPSSLPHVGLVLDGHCAVPKWQLWRPHAFTIEPDAGHHWENATQPWSAIGNYHRWSLETLVFKHQFLSFHFISFHFISFRVLEWTLGTSFWDAQLSRKFRKRKKNDLQLWGMEPRLQCGRDPRRDPARARNGAIGGVFTVCFRKLFSEK